MKDTGLDPLALALEHTTEAFESTMAVNESNTESVMAQDSFIGHTALHEVLVGGLVGELVGVHTAIRLDYSLADQMSCCRVWTGQS